MAPWVTYLIADGMGLSGIVAILINGVFLQIYAAPNISRASRKVLKIAYESIAYSAEILVFIFLGIGIFAFNHPTDKVGFGAVLLGLINFGVARLLNVFTVTTIVNRTRTDT
jgi:sodium/hydrogen exchanger 8